MRCSIFFPACTLHDSSFLFVLRFTRVAFMRALFSLQPSRVFHVVEDIFNRFSFRKHFLGYMCRDTYLTIEPSHNGTRYANALLCYNPSKKASIESLLRNTLVGSLLEIVFLEGIFSSSPACEIHGVIFATFAARVDRLIRYEVIYHLIS
jgi:hypothetical protein